MKIIKVKKKKKENFNKKIIDFFFWKFDIHFNDPLIQRPRIVPGLEGIDQFHLFVV